MISGNGIIFKGDGIILPEALQEKALALAHQGSHPSQSALQSRLRFHFFFYDMNNMVQKLVEKCENCQLFTDKKTMEPIQPHCVPNKCWEKVSVDLFGPMPSFKHIVVVQDLSSRYPAAKIVSSTKAENVIPALSDIYNTLGNPDVQLSDNGPPFNSQKMKRSITMQHIPPFHPSATTVETFMCPIGKTMKIAHHNKTPATEALSQLLNNYRNTPHPATGIPPPRYYVMVNNQVSLEG